MTYAREREIFLDFVTKKHVLEGDVRAAGRVGQPAEVSPHDAGQMPILMALAPARSLG